MALLAAAARSAALGKAVEEPSADVFVSARGAAAVAAHVKVRTRRASDHIVSHGMA